MEKFNEFLEKPIGKVILVAVGVVIGIFVGLKVKKPYGRK